MKKRIFLLLLLTVACGCARPYNVLRTNNPNYDHVWTGTIDAVSNYLIVVNADKDKGLIVARSRSQWVRTEATVQITKVENQHDVKVTVNEQKIQVFLRPSGLKSAERVVPIRENKELEKKMLRDIAANVRVVKSLWVSLKELMGKGKKKEAEKKPEKKKPPLPQKQEKKSKKGEKAKKS